MVNDLASKQRKFLALSFQSNFDIFIIQFNPYEPKFLAAFLYL